MLVRNTLFLAVLGVLGCTDACAQAVWQADVQIQGFTVTAATGLVRPSRQAPLPRVAPPGSVTPLAPPIASDALDINVVVFSNNDDDARNARLLVFLPPESRVISMPTSCVAPPPPGATAPTNNAYVTCTLGDMGVNATKAVRVTIARPPSYVVPRVGVFAYSESPDPNTSNNHAEVVAQ